LNQYKESKKTVISEFKVHERDTGSADVQIALITKRINYLTDHFKQHKKDHASRRGLLCLVSRRKRLLSFLKKEDPSRYQVVLDKLGLRK